MGKEKEYSIMQDDYRQFILEKLYGMDAVRTCIYCGVEFLTGKDESAIYAAVTNAFKEKYGNNYDNVLMKKLIKEILSERFVGHSCDR
jgi:hypothetical protein